MHGHWQLLLAASVSSKKNDACERGAKKVLPVFEDMQQDDTEFSCFCHLPGRTSILANTNCNQASHHAASLWSHGIID